MARRRSLAVLAIFASAILVAFVAPRFAFGLVCSALILHVRPEALSSRSVLTKRSIKTRFTTAGGRPPRVPQPKEQQWDFHGSRGPWGAIRTEGFSQQARCPSGCSSRSHYAAE